MKFSKAFTLIEVLLVVAIGAGIFALSAPYSLNFYRTQLINDAQSNVIDALQRARHYAVLQKNDSNFGVHFVAGSYTLFQTSDTYDSRVDDLDEVFTVIDGITFTGEENIIFSKLTGVTSTTSTTTLTYGTISRSISIDESGTVSKVE